MKKSIQFNLIILLVFTASSFTVHKFYVSIYKIDYVAKKKMIQITSRIFIDDMNEALEKKYHKKTFVGTNKETKEDEALMNNYLSEKMIFRLNKITMPIHFLSKEVEANVIISYFNIKDISKITTLSLENGALLEINEEQQNIIQANITGEKQSLLFTLDNYKGMLK